MQEESEQDRTEKEDAAFGDAKSDSSSCHVRVTKPSTDLNRYIVDKFHPPTARAKQVPFESIDLSIYKPSARCLAFCTSEDRLLFWITAFAQRYYELLTRQTAGYKITWKEQDGYSSPSKCDKLVIHLVETTPSSEEEVLVTITVFITTGRIQVQGKRIEEWNAHEFPVLLECVNKLSDIKHFAGISSIPDQYQSLFASSLHNFFVNFIHFVAEEGIPSSNCNTSDDLSQEKITTKATSSSAPDHDQQPLTITPSRLKTISSLRDTLGELEAEFTQFKMITSGDLQQLKDKIVQQDNLLKLQRKTIDYLSSDLSSHAQLSQEMFSQQSAHVKKLQEENQSLQKKHSKTLESNLVLQKSCNELLTEVNFLKDQVRELWKKPLDIHASLDEAIDPHAISHPSPTVHEKTDEVHPPLLLVDIPSENPVQENTMHNEKIPSPNAQQQRNNGSSHQSPPISVKPNTAAFLCDSNGKFLNMTKLFHPKQELKYFRCPTIEDGRSTLQTNLQEHPKLLVIHTGTNNLTPNSQIDDFVSEISAFVTEASTKFPKSKIIYSTLLPRSDLPLYTITKINEQLINQLTNLHNAHVVSHDNVFSKGLDVLHDAKHLKKRHIGLFAANLVEAIRGRTRPTRTPSNHLSRPPFPPRFTPPQEKYGSYSDAVKNFGRGSHATQPPQQSQPLPLLDYRPSQVLQPASHRPVTNWQFPARPDYGKDPPDAVKNFGRGGHHTTQPPQQNQPPPLLDYQPSQVLQPVASSGPNTSWQSPAKTDNGKNPPVDIPRELMSLLRFIKTYV